MRVGRVAVTVKRRETPLDPFAEFRQAWRDLMIETALVWRIDRLAERLGLRLDDDVLARREVRRNS